MMAGFLSAEKHSCFREVTMLRLFLSRRECTLPRRGTWSKCLQGSLTIHGSTSLLMGPTTILIIDDVIDSVVLPPLMRAAELRVWHCSSPPSHDPSRLIFHLSRKSAWFLHLSFVICRADRAVFSSSVSRSLRLMDSCQLGLRWWWSAGRCWREAALIGDKRKLIGGKNTSGSPRRGYLTPVEIKHSLGW